MEAEQDSKMVRISPNRAVQTQSAGQLCTIWLGLQQSSTVTHTWGIGTHLATEISVLVSITNSDMCRAQGCYKVTLSEVAFLGATRL